MVVAACDPVAVVGVDLMCEDERPRGTVLRHVFFCITHVLATTMESHVRADTTRTPIYTL